MVCREYYILLAQSCNNPIKETLYSYKIITMKSLKIALIGTMALFGFGLATIVPVSAQNFTTTQQQVGVNVP